MRPELKFLFFLGLKLGRTVTELSSMSSTEFSHWVAYFELSLPDSDENKKEETNQTLLKLDALAHADR